MSEANPVVMDRALWESSVRIAKVPGEQGFVPHNYTGREWRDLKFDEIATIIAWLKQTPAHGSVRPSAPVRGDVFLLTGTAPALLYCEQPGTWTDIPLSGQAAAITNSQWVLGYERVDQSTAPTAGQFRPLIADNTRWEINLRATDEFALKVGDKIAWYNAAEHQRLDGVIVEANTNDFTPPVLLISLNSVVLDIAYAAAPRTGWILAKGEGPFPYIGSPLGNGTAAPGNSGYWADGKHVHPAGDVEITAPSILDAIKATRTSADRNKQVVTSATNENALELRDLPAANVLTWD